MGIAITFEMNLTFNMPIPLLEKYVHTNMYEDTPAKLMSQFICPSIDQSINYDILILDNIL